MMSFEGMIGKKFKTNDGIIVKCWEVNAITNQFIFKSPDGSKLYYDANGVLKLPALGAGMNLKAEVKS